MLYTEKQFNEFYQAYITALAWSGIVGYGDDAEYADEFDYSKDALEKCRMDCKAFLNPTVCALIVSATKDYDHYNWSQAGHDFALTRNGHSAGFWDRCIGGYGDELTELSEAMGGVVLYLDDNEELQIDC